MILDHGVTGSVPDFEHAHVLPRGSISEKRPDDFPVGDSSYIKAGLTLRKSIVARAVSLFSQIGKQSLEW